MKFSKIMLVIILAVGSVACAEVSELDGIGQTLTCNATTGISVSIPHVSINTIDSYHFKMSDEYFVASGGKPEKAKCPCFTYTIVLVSGSENVILDFKLADGLITGTLTANPEFMKMPKGKPVPVTHTLVN